MSNIKFGTDGWRAVVGKDFNEENVKRLQKQLANMFLITLGWIKKLS